MHFDLLHKLIKEHLHDGEIILKLVHNLIPQRTINKEYILILSESLAIDFTLFQSDVTFVGYHALPFGQHQDEDLGLP
jgi:hypothetical protein